MVSFSFPFAYRAPLFWDFCCFSCVNSISMARIMLTVWRGKLSGALLRDASKKNGNSISLPGVKCRLVSAGRRFKFGSVGAKLNNCEKWHNLPTIVMSSRSTRVHLTSMRRNEGFARKSERAELFSLFTSIWRLLLQFFMAICTGGLKCRIVATSVYVMCHPLNLNTKETHAMIKPTMTLTSSRHSPSDVVTAVTSISWTF